MLKTLLLKQLYPLRSQREKSTRPLAGLRRRSVIAADSMQYARNHPILWRINEGVSMRRRQA